MNKALIDLHIATFLFGLAGVLAQLMTLDAFAIACARAGLGAIYIFFVAHFLKKQRFHCALSDLLPLLSLGAILAIHWASFFYAIKTSSVAIGLITFSSFPLFTNILEPLLLKTKSSLIEWVSSALIVIGIVILTPWGEGLSGNITQGILWGLGSGFTFALLQVLNKKLTHQYSPQLLSFSQNGFAALLLLPLAFTSLISFETKDLGLVLILGFVCTGFAHTLFIQSLKGIKTHYASIIVGGLEPVYGVILAIFLLNEIPHLQTLIGGSFIILAIFLSTKKVNTSN